MGTGGRHHGSGHTSWISKRCAGGVAVAGIEFRRGGLGVSKHCDGGDSDVERLRRPSTCALHR
jgi:hypothetical protein